VTEKRAAKVRTPHQNSTLIVTLLQTILQRRFLTIAEVDNSSLLDLHLSYIPRFLHETAFTLLRNCWRRFNTVPSVAQTTRDSGINDHRGCHLHRSRLQLLGRFCAVRLSTLSQNFAYFPSDGDEGTGSATATTLCDGTPVIAAAI
jgi:hypothetical protein